MKNQIAIFGPHGKIAAHHPQFEFRPGQMEMAEAVSDAIEHERHLIVEAGTGTGKTLAYLIPAIQSGKRVVVSTGTKNLQEQLFFKDVPFLEELFPGKFQACLMKGRANYLCLKKLAEIQSQPMLESLEEVDVFQEIESWSKVTETGDRAELEDLPEDLSLWSRLDARAEDCLGQKCSDYERCFVVRMRERARQSSLIIANHHLVFADMAVRESDFGEVLPEYDVLILDEAHTIENISTQYFGTRVSNYRVDELIRDTRSAMKVHSISSGDLDDALHQVTLRSTGFLGPLMRPEGRYPLIPTLPQIDHLEDLFSQMLSSLGLLQAKLENLPDKPEMIYALVRRCRLLAADLEFLVHHESEDYVYWLECRGSGRRHPRLDRPNRAGIFLQASPIHVAAMLRERLFDRIRSVILTSATLSVDGHFNFIKSRLGLDSYGDAGRVREALCASHFDHERQAILFIPMDLPQPGSSRYTEKSVELIAQLLEMTEGHAFILFTSFHQMEKSYRELRNRVDYPVFIQGELARTALLNKFRKTRHAVLCATASFWQGVDVVGEQLSCVIIDKLPFAVPDDPIVRARTEALEASGRNGFLEYQVPEAVIQLKQGLGRLIRSSRDYGLLAVLDDRVIRKSYGSLFLSSLPKYRVTHHVEDVRDFLKAHRGNRREKASPSAGV
jgi:ATP-dependent DNA helicase DinG